MKHRVVISDAALDDVRRFLSYLTEERQAPDIAERWQLKALAAIDSLEHFPNRCPLAPENSKSGLTIRMLRVDPCLFLFRVDDPGKTVRLLRMRHGSQMPLAIE